MPTKLSKCSPIGQCVQAAQQFCPISDASSAIDCNIYRSGGQTKNHARRRLAADNTMKKSAYFASRDFDGWPTLPQLEPYFLSPPGPRWFFQTGNDGAVFYADGVDGTEHLPANEGRIDIRLEMWAHSELGVLLIWSKWGGGFKLTYSSKGDLSRLREWVRSLHDTPLPVGLFVPFERAWAALKEFIEHDCKLPTSIEWIANHDLPPNTFPDP